MQVNLFLDPKPTVPLIGGGVDYDFGLGCAGSLGLSADKEEAEGRAAGLAAD